MHQCAGDIPAPQRWWTGLFLWHSSSEYMLSSVISTLVGKRGRSLYSRTVSFIRIHSQWRISQVSKLSWGACRCVPLSACLLHQLKDTSLQLQESTVWRTHPGQDRETSLSIPPRYTMPALFLRSGSFYHRIPETLLNVCSLTCTDIFHFRARFHPQNAYQLQ